jgi:replication factor C small subunit
VVDFKINGAKQKMAAQFFKRVEWILEKENITYSKDVVAAVITKHFPDNRRVLNELQRYSVSGTIDSGILSNIADIQLDTLITALKGKDFGSTRKWVTANLDNDPVKIYRKLYDTLYEVLKPQSVPQLVLILAKYQYQAAFVADHEINMVACLTEIMVDCEFK